MHKFIVAAALLSASTTAFAQDAGSAPFAGPYAGVELGYGKRSIDEASGLTGVQRFDRSRDGLDYGLFAGFNAPVGSAFILGGEANIGAGGKTLRQTLATGVTGTADPKWNYALTGKAGFLAGERAMVYGLAGYGAERLRVTIADTRAGGLTVSDKGWSDGLVWGGGVEFALSPATSMRVEYRQKDFDGSYKPQQVMTGLSVRF